MALGTFDGVHLGHQKLLNRAVALGEERQLASAVFTFDYPPEHFFTGKLEMLTDLARKQELVLAHGIDHFVWTQFNKEFAAIAPEDFIKNIIVGRLKAKIVVCGYDYHFGHNAKGTPKLLQESGRFYDFQVDIIPPYQHGQTVVSSTKIRQLLITGEIEQATKLLGRYPSYTGSIVSGKQLGRKLGFPTANISINPELLIPGSGVYLTWCHLKDGSNYPSMTSVGSNPTVKGDQVSVESYLIGYHGNLYGDPVKLQFLSKMRDMEHFESIDLLKSQLEDDLAHALEILPHYRLQRP